MFRLLSACLFLALAACSSVNNFEQIRSQVTSIDDKKAALNRGKRHWKGADSVQSYGRSRSHQIIDLNRWKITDKAVTYDGDAGLASVITADGYALTAEHVLRRNGRSSGILSYADGPKRMHAASRLEKNQSTGLLEVKGNVPVLYPFDGKPLSRFDPFNTAKLRIIHRFRGRDLVLIKLPASKAPYFKRGRPPQKGDWLFNSGSGISLSPFSSAGQALWKTHSRRIRTSAPAATGDSGGPLFNSRGQLVGIITDAIRTRATAEQGERNLQESEAVLPDWDLVDQLIAADRKKFPSQ